MDEALPQHTVASPVDRVLEPMRTNKVTAEVSGQNDNECNRLNVEICPTPGLLADPTRSGSERDFAPTLLQQMPFADAPKAFIEPADAICTNQRGVANVLHVGCGVYEPAKNSP